MQLYVITCFNKYVIKMINGRKSRLNLHIWAEYQCCCIPFVSFHCWSLSLSSGHSSEIEIKTRTIWIVEDKFFSIGDKVQLHMMLQSNMNVASPPCGSLWKCIYVSQEPLTCFTIKAVEVHWEVKTSDLFLEHFNIFGVYFPCPGWKIKWSLWKHWNT